jgi:hypothetical protein
MIYILRREIFTNVGKKGNIVIGSSTKQVYFQIKIKDTIFFLVLEISIISVVIDKQRTKAVEKPWLAEWGYRGFVLIAYQNKH